MFDVAESIYAHCLDLFAISRNTGVVVLGIRESHVGSGSPDSGGTRVKFSL